MKTTSNIFFFKIIVVTENSGQINLFLFIEFTLKFSFHRNDDDMLFILNY